MGFSSNLLEIGAEAELVLFDANKSWRFDKDNILSKSYNSLNLFSMVEKLNSIFLKIFVAGKKVILVPVIGPLSF